MTVMHLPVTTDSFEQYMAQINRFDILSRQEEFELARRYKQRGDVDAAHSRGIPGRF